MDIIKQITDGADLRICLRPARGLVKGNHYYQESLSLPHVFVEGSVFWGYTSTSHTRLLEGDMTLMYDSDGSMYKTGFCYSNYRGGIFGEVNSNDDGVDPPAFISPINFCYESHNWITKKFYTRIYSRDDIVKAINGGYKLKVLLEVKKEKWAPMHSRYYMGEVFLPYLFDSRKIYLLCKPFHYINAAFSRRAMDFAVKRKRFIGIKGIIPEQYLVDLDGQYRRLSDSKSWDKGMWFKTDMIKIFVENGEEIEMSLHRMVACKENKKNSKGGFASWVTKKLSPIPSTA